MNAKAELLLQSNPPSLTTLSGLEGVTLAWASGTPSSNTEINSTLKFAPRNYPHTPEQIAKELRVDEEGRLWWYPKKSRRTDRPAGTICSNGYRYISLYKQRYLSASLAWCLYYGRWPLSGKVIDHINHNTLDDRKENLREVSNAINLQNRKGLTSHNTSGVTGVYWGIYANKWQVTLVVEGKKISGGNYKKFEDAVAARRQLEIDYGVADYAVVTDFINPKLEDLFQHSNISL